MIKSKKELIQAEKKMILFVQDSNLSDIDPHQMTYEDAEILMQCIKSGYLIGVCERDGHELRTLDGKAHPELLSTNITPAGSAFLKPNKTDVKATAAIIISILSLAIAVLSNLQEIVQSVGWIADLLKSIIQRL